MIDPIPIDMQRWTVAFEQLRAAVLEVGHMHIPAADLPNTWTWIRTNYAASLAVYSRMTADQQSTVRERLEALRVKLEALSH